MRIYTKTGDRGTTALASGERVSKADLRLEAYGTADELNSFVGLLRAEDMPNDEELSFIQNKLFNIGACLASADGEWITADDVHRLEQSMDAMQAELEPIRGFILPAGNRRVSLCHVCRTITRRLERHMVALRMQIEDEKRPDETPSQDKTILMQFVNRLSDFWFVLAEKMAKNDKISIFLWKK